MEIKNKNDGHRGVFYMEEDGKEFALMHYIFSGPGKMIIDHTEVNEDHGGHGYGKMLVKAGVEYAREHQMKILPLCPFAKKIFNITPEFAECFFN